MKNLLKKTMVACLCACTCLSLVGCGGPGGNDSIVQDGKTVNIKVLKAGYGTTWLNKVAEKFEAAYADEGYQINILTPDTSLKGPAALSEMRLGKKSGVDLYIVGAVDVDSVIDPEYGICAEELTDMYDQKAIKFDGTEEAETVAQKLDDAYDDNVSSGGKYYGFLWANSPCGLVVNTKALASYNLEIPNTTDELFACYDTIYAQASSTGVYPTTWGGNNAYGYALYSLYANLAQILGETGYQQFNSLQAGATIAESDWKEGYKLYENDDVYTALDILMKQYDTDMSTAGSVTDTHDRAHYNLITGKAVFAVDGEFFFNEVKANYKNYMNDVTFVNIPVNSAVGDKLGIEDEVLSCAIEQVDAQKSVADIISAVQTAKGVTLTEMQVNTIIEARGAYYEKADHSAYIVKGSPVADVAKLFLRMLASDEAAAIFNETAYASSPYAISNTVDSEYAFVKGVASVVNNQYAWAVESGYTGLRKKANIDMYSPYGVDIVLSMASTDKDINGLKTEIKNNIQNKWSDYMKAAGYTV